MTAAVCIAGTPAQSRPMSPQRAASVAITASNNSSRGFIRAVPHNTASGTRLPGPHLSTGDSKLGQQHAVFAFIRDEEISGRPECQPGRAG